MCPGALVYEMMFNVRCLLADILHRCVGSQHISAGGVRSLYLCWPCPGGFVPSQHCQNTLIQIQECDQKGEKEKEQSNRTWPLTYIIMNLRIHEQEKKKTTSSTSLHPRLRGKHARVYGYEHNQKCETKVKGMKMKGISRVMVKGQSRYKGHSHRLARAMSQCRTASRLVSSLALIP